MLALNLDITTLAYLSNSYLTTVEGVKMLRDLSESRHKVISGCVSEPYDYNVFLVPVKNLMRDFVPWEFLWGDGKLLVDITFGPSVADYATRLIDPVEVTKFIDDKATILKYYKLTLIYLPIVLPLTKKCCVFEGPLEDPKVTDSLFKLTPLPNSEWKQSHKAVPSGQTFIKVMCSILSSLRQVITNLPPPHLQSSPYASSTMALSKILATPTLWAPSSSTLTTSLRSILHFALATSLQNLQQLQSKIYSTKNSSPPPLLPLWIHHLPAPSTSNLRHLPGQCYFLQPHHSFSR